jgi:hypothetical protein
LVANDIPWLALNEPFLDNGNMQFDKSQSNVLAFAEGITVWNASPPSTYTGNWNWVSQGAGIEQLVANEIVSPPGGAVVLASWDRAIFRITNKKQYPSSYPYNTANQIVPAWGVDYSASTPSYLVCYTNTGGTAGSAYSTNGGITWTAFAAQPTNGAGTYANPGSIACSTTTNTVVASGLILQNTKDGGVTWNNVQPGGVTAGWGVVQKKRVAADRVTANSFLAWNDGSGTPAAEGMWLSTNSGDTWTQQCHGVFSLGQSWQYQIHSVPGNAGHYFITGGQSTSSTQPDASSKFYRTTNNGVTWTDVSNGSYVIREVWAFGFGAIAAGQTYPEVAIWGWINGTLGFWTSVDNCATWQMTGDAHFGLTFDVVSCISGDSNVAGAWYVGFSGSGYFQF